MKKAIVPLLSLFAAVLSMPVDAQNSTPPETRAAQPAPPENAFRRPKKSDKAADGKPVGDSGSKSPSIMASTPPPSGTVGTPPPSGKPPIGAIPEGKPMIGTAPPK